MMGDFIVTAMYFGASFSATSFIASKVMFWLFGVWILGMLLAPFNKEHTILKKVTEYGSIVALGPYLLRILFRICKNINHRILLE